MKIYTLPPSSFYRGVGRKKEDSPLSEKESPEKERKAKQQQEKSNSEEESKDSTEKGFQPEMEQALQSFQEDTQTHAHGLSADLEGQGPGLKVILKDRNGVVIRQLSGSEFLELHEASSKEFKARGKILDRKL